jgi:hypothetical protein
MSVDYTHTRQRAVHPGSAQSCCRDSDKKNHSQIFPPSELFGSLPLSVISLICSQMLTHEEYYLILEERLQRNGRWRRDKRLKEWKIDGRPNNIHLNGFPHRPVCVCPSSTDPLGILPLEETLQRSAIWTLSRLRIKRTQQPCEYRL